MVNMRRKTGSCARRQGFAVQTAGFRRLIAQVATRARDRKPFVVEQALDHEDGVDVLAAIQSVAFRAFYRLQHGELRLPVSQDKLLRAGHAADLADPEQVLVRDSRFVLSVIFHVYSRVVGARHAVLLRKGRTNYPAGSRSPTRQS